MLEITRESALTGKTRTRALDVTPAQLEAHEAGMLAQDAFPHLSAWDREFLISGATQEEWDAFFKGDD